ncbi:DUF192 domain-containing protein [Halorarum halophilum]|uniref:DUF192 domain-containing protein n=1 Tax=Halorarum halophilum TaxID=2743090 RepID=A0A7D5GDB8_9EURY|nr:DUF192 domain-containing protein [Halobaculum halophilum]QLG26050.1 DUF192 domain-containing protein [Halobaculum halophilum]
MDRRRIVPLALLVLALALAGVLAFAPGLLVTGEYDRTTVAIYDADGTDLATVNVSVADTYPKRYVGLSDTESLDENEGMLFVHSGTGKHAYVMREMDFPIDIVFVAANGTITRIHHARLPADGSGDRTRYRGTGKYVLEVPYGYTNRTGVDEGDRVVIAGDY